MLIYVILLIARKARSRLKAAQTECRIMDVALKKKYTAYETKVSQITERSAVCVTQFSSEPRSPELITEIDLHTSCSRLLAGADLRDSLFSGGGWRELTYVRLLRVVHGSLRATFMPARQYSSLDTARTVMSRRRNYVIGPRGALPILPLLQLLLPRLPQGVVLLSAWVSIIVGTVRPGDVWATRSLPADRRKFAIRGPGVLITVLPMLQMSLISPREDSGVS